MTRFDAATGDARRELVADAIRAHDARGSAFLTVEAERDDGPGPDTTDEGDETEPVVPWVQFADGVLNLDCTDDELDSLKSLLDSFPAFTIDALENPEDAAGTNVRVAARTDPERVAELVDRVFVGVYGCPEDYRMWVTAV